jgi:multidrug resistance efflux pump
MIAVVVVLLRHRSERIEVVGLAKGRVHQIAANCEGRIKQINVELFDAVTAGDKVVVIDTVLDNENLQAQLATAQAEVEHLRAQLAPIREQFEAEAANLETDTIAARRRFEVDIENFKLRILELKTQLETNRITLEDLAVEVKIVKGLVQQEAVAPYELQKAEAQHNTLAKQIEENEHLLIETAKDLIRAQDRRDEYFAREPQHQTVDSALEVIRQAIIVQTKRVEELEASREPLELKAGISGIVSFVQHSAGEAILAGEPILTIAETKPYEIVAYADEKQMGRIHKQMKVKLIKTGEPIKVTPSQVVALGPKMELLPERLWPNPNMPQWGRPIRIKIPPKFDLVPGELVGIKGL